ncbi:MAG: hypothetical protein M3252_06510 [Actinomycetota bacterium]|nr:hypothetical protein [Actinomycetota bacterium]
MRFEELAFVCQEAARDLVARETRPLPVVVVLPGPRATRLVRIPDWPDDESARLALLSALAHDEILSTSTPAYGFLAEAEIGAAEDVLLVVYGAHDRPPHVTAAPFADGELGEFLEAEPLDPDALSFLRPLQHAVDAVRVAPAPPGIPGFGA